MNIYFCYNRNTIHITDHNHHNIIPVANLNHEVNPSANNIKENINKKNMPTVIETSDAIEVITDRFGEYPVYKYQTQQELVLFSRFSDLVKHKADLRLTPNIAGIWESLIYDMTLNNGTIYNEIEIIPQGSIYRIYKDNFKTEIKYHEKYHFEKVSEYTLEEAGMKLSSLLCDELKTIDKKNIILPLSGGIDSRLLAILLSKLYQPEKIKVISFAGDKKSYELRYSKSICNTLGIKNWSSHLLDENTYLGFLDTVVSETGGMLSMMHGHLYDALKRKRCFEENEAVLISGAFADAAGGYAAIKLNIDSDDLKHSSYFLRLQKLNSHLKIVDDYYLKILDDLQFLFNRWKEDSNIETFDEYFYVAQRQPKLLFALSALYSQFLKVHHPFVSAKIANFLFSMPFELRKYKSIIRSAVKFSHKQLYELPDISSKMISDNYKRKYHTIRGKVYNNLALIMTVLYGDRRLVFSPFQTESQDYLLRTSFRNLVYSSLSQLKEFGIINDRQFEVIYQKPYKQYGGGVITTMQYRAITLAKTLQSYC
ncbi:MAG: asparagine synthase C-terminal domain-containing protein [Melioribacteraceae bacterium]|nr:asparagine synthase C-terminal domain-containing protein [Melioribacteraceae bacterium]